jgi:NADPH:quinone reductase-like Zn-dependent oxidoreductase
VGTAAVQLAAARGGHVIAIAASSKTDALRSCGADSVVARDAPLVDDIGSESVDVVVDVVGGGGWPQLLDVLRRGGRYVVSGAIGGPIVELDLRTLYLKDITLFGATYQMPDVLPDVIARIEQGRVRPMLHAVYPLTEIHAAQAAFLAKDFVGKLVLIP